MYSHHAPEFSIQPKFTRMISFWNLVFTCGIRFMRFKILTSQLDFLVSWTTKYLHFLERFLSLNWAGWYPTSASKSVFRLASQFSQFFAIFRNECTWCPWVTQTLSSLYCYFTWGKLIKTISPDFKPRTWLWRNSGNGLSMNRTLNLLRLKENPADLSNKSNQKSLYTV